MKWIVVALVLSTQDPSVVATLEIGRPVDGEMREQDPRPQSPGLATFPSDGPIRAQVVQFHHDGAEPVTIELESFVFDAYLVARLGDVVVAEDDDGGPLTGSRVVLPATAPGDYEVAVCALHGQVGPYRLTASSGEPPPPDPIREFIADFQAQQRRAVALRRLLPEGDVRRAQAWLDFASMQVTAGQFAQVGRSVDRALDELDVDAPEAESIRATAAALRGRALRNQGRIADALPFYFEVVERTEAYAGRDSVESAIALDNLSLVLGDAGRFEDALAHNAEALATFEQILGPDAASVAQAGMNRGCLLLQLGRDTEAAEQLRRSVDIFEVTGPEPSLAIALDNLSVALMRTRDLEAAAAANGRAREILERILPSGHPSRYRVRLNQSSLLAYAGKYRESADVLEEVAREIEASGAQVLAILPELEVQRAAAARQAGRWNDARHRLLTALEALDSGAGRDPMLAAEVLLQLGRLEYEQGDDTAARRVLAEGMERLRAAGKSDDTLYATLELHATIAAAARSDPRDVRTGIWRNVEALLAVPSTPPLDRADHLLAAAQGFCEATLPQDALRAANRAAALLEGGGPDHPSMVLVHRVRARARLQLGSENDARRAYREAHRVAVARYGERTLVAASVAAEFGNYLSTIQRIDEAIELLESAVRDFSRELGESSSALFEPLIALADTNVDAGRFDVAAELLTRARAIAEEHFPGDPIVRATVLRTEAHLAQGRMHDDEAERGLRSALEVLGEDRALTGTRERIETELCLVLARNGRADEALQRVERIVAADRERYGGDSTIAFGLLNRVGTACMEGGRHDVAQRLFRSIDAAEVRRGDWPIWSTYAHNMGLSSALAGDLTHALTWYRESIDAVPEEQRRDHWRLALTEAQMGGVLLQLGRIDDGLAAIRAGIDRVRARFGPNHIQTLMLSSHLAVALGLVGRESESYDWYLQILEQKLKVLPADHPSLLHSRANAARAALGLGDPARAELESRMAYEALRRLFPRGHRSLFGSMTLLGRSLNALGRHDEGLAVFGEKLDLERDYYPSGHPELRISRQNFAIALLEAGKWKEAEQAFRAVMADRPADAHVDPLGLAAAEHLSIALALQGRTAESVEAAARALDTGVAWIRDGRWLSSTADFEGLQARTRTLVEVLLSCDAAAAELADSEERRARLYGSVVRWKGAARARNALTLRGARTAEDPETQRLLTELRYERTRLSNAVWASEGLDPERRAEELQIVRSNLDRLERALLERVPTRAVPAVGVEDLAAHLPPGGVFVDFLVWHDWLDATPNSPSTEARVSKTRMTAWITRPGDRGPAVVQWDEVETLIEDAEQLLGSMGVDRSRRPRGSGPEPGTVLRDRLWKQLARAIGDASLVLVAPDGFLQGVPFGMLPTGDRQRPFLLMERDFVYLTDAASAVEVAQSDVPSWRDPGPMLVVGGVDFEGEDDAVGASRRAPPFPPLQYDMQEANAIIDLFQRRFDGAPQPTLRSGRAASERMIKELLPGNAFVHIITHGTYQPRGPASNWQNVFGTEMEAPTPDLALRRALAAAPGTVAALACAGANATASRADEDGMLTAEEIAWLDLSATRLAVLSACESALGRSLAGGEMAGLRRAFHAAGVRGVISTLWPVDDAATAKIMADAYDRIWTRGLSPHAALRAAQLDFLRQTVVDGDGAQPRKWAGLVYSGDWR